MIIHRKLYLLAMIVGLIVTACAPQVAVTPIPISAPATLAVHDEPITLHLAVSDAEGRPSESFVLDFVDQIKNLSNGTITVVPTWDAGAETTPDFEQGVVKLVKEGSYELGLAGSRAWDNSGVTSFQALQAPFLITNDALAEAVASSETGTRMLVGLSSVGIIGLGLWPEDLRHPFSINPDKPILSPDDLKGLAVRSIPSEVSYTLIKTLGGNPMYGDEYQAAESGLRQGASLTGSPTATGNVIFFPKFQVLFANGAAFEKLSESQRSILRDAAAATQKKAIAEHPREADAAAAWCADGGTVVIASEEQVAAFEAAAQPVFDKIEQDPLNAEFIAAIRELKMKTTPSLGAVACAPVLANASPEPSTELEVWSTGLPPNGAWQAEITTDDFVRMGVLRSVAETEWAGVYTISFRDGKYLMIWEGLQGQLGKCGANYQLVGDIVRLIYTSDYGCSSPPNDIQWRIDDEGLHLHLLVRNGFVDAGGKAFFEAKPWQKVE